MLFFSTINVHLQQQGLSFFKGTVVDVSIIAEPASIKNKDQARAKPIGNVLSAIACEH